MVHADDEIDLREPPNSVTVFFAVAQPNPSPHLRATDARKMPRGLEGFASPYRLSVALSEKTLTCSVTTSHASLSTSLRRTRGPPEQHPSAQNVIFSESTGSLRKYGGLRTQFRFPSPRRSRTS